MVPSASPRSPSSLLASPHNPDSVVQPLLTPTGESDDVIIEAAVHAVRKLSNDPDTDAILLVDASNAFNLLNRKVALLNILRKCPSLAKLLINTYRHNPQLFVDGEVLLSQEGTTQGGSTGNGYVRHWNPPTDPSTGPTSKASVVW